MIKKQDILSPEAIASDLKGDIDYINLLKCRIKLSGLYFNMKAYKKDGLWYLYYKCEVNITNYMIMQHSDKNINIAAKLVFEDVLGYLK